MPVSPPPSCGASSQTVVSHVVKHHPNCTSSLHLDWLSTALGIRPNYMCDTHTCTPAPTSCSSCLPLPLRIPLHPPSASPPAQDALCPGCAWLSPSPVNSHSSLHSSLTRPGCLLQHPDSTMAPRPSLWSTIYSVSWFHNSRMWDAGGKCTSNAV